MTEVSSKAAYPPADENADAPREAPLRIIDLCCCAGLAANLEPAPPATAELRGRMTPVAIMRGWRVGSADHSWIEEKAQLWERDRGALEALAASISAEGVREPVLLGDDDRVWDGHHRIIAAAYVDSGMFIPVEFGHGG